MLGKYFTRQGNGRWNQQTWSVKLGRWVRHAPWVYLAATGHVLWWLIWWKAKPFPALCWDDGKIAKTFNRWETFMMAVKAARARVASRVGNYMTLSEVMDDLKSRTV